MKIIMHDGSIAEYTFEDEIGRDSLRHTASHILAQAVKRLFPDTKLAIGPSIKDGFYYDFDRPEPFEETDLVTNFTAIASAINNIGPGLAKVGPMANFAHFSVLSKLTLIFDMLAGRLELFPMLILFNPSTWKR